MQIVTVPEPGTVVLGAIGLILSGIVRGARRSR
jgi:hypothetical protein